MVQARAAEEHVQKPAPPRAQRGRLRTHTPDALQVGPRSFRPPLGMTIDQHGGIHRASRSARDAVDLQPGFLPPPIKTTPGNGAVRPAALQCEVDENGIEVVGVSDLSATTGEGPRRGPRDTSREFFSLEAPVRRT